MLLVQSGDLGKIGRWRASVANVIKLFFLFVADEEANYDGVFVPGKPFQPSLIFASKVRACQRRMA